MDEFPIRQRIRPVKAHAEKDCRNDFSAAGHVVPSPDGVPPYDFAGDATWLLICGFSENEYYGFRSIAAPKLPGTVEADSLRINLFDRHGPDARRQEDTTALDAQTDYRYENKGLSDRRVR